MHALPPLIYDLALMLCVASIVTVIFQKIRQPIVLGYLIVGIIIGPYTPPHALVNDHQNIKILSELGVIFLIFSLGLEFNFHKLARVGFSASVTGFAEVLLMTIIGFTLGKMLGWSFNNAIFLGAALSISSTTIIIKVIDELNLMKQRFAELIFGILVVEDLLAILLLVVLSTVVVTHDVLTFNMLWVIGKLILVVGGWFIIGYFLIPTLHRVVMPHASEEAIIVISVSLCLFLVSLAAYLNYSIALGAFIMGSILAETTIIHRIRTLIKPLRDIFAAVFFISIGMLMDPEIVIQQWHIILIITVVTVIGKIFTTGLSSFLTGQSLNTSLRVGFGMAQIGEFSFIIVGLGVTLNAVDDRLYPIIVAASVITTFTTPYLIHVSGYLAKTVDAKLPDDMKLFLDSYSAAVCKNLSGFTQDKQYKYSMGRLIGNAIIIAIIFSLNYHFLFPHTKDLFEGAWISKTLCWFLALLLSSPFLWGMIFSSKPSKRVTAKNYFDLHFFTTWILTLLEITFLSFVYFQAWPVVICLILIMIVFLIVAYGRLERTYHWFENHLVKNIKNRADITEKYEDLAPWHTYLVEVKMGSKVPFYGKTIRDYRIRERFEINIVAIQNDQNTIFAPTGKNIISPHDKLIILGNKESVKKFRKEIEGKSIQSKDALKNVALKTMLIKKNSIISGKTIRESKIRERIQGMVVGLERKGNRILNPDPNTQLQAGDLLFIVGEVKYLKSINDISEKY